MSRRDVVSLNTHRGRASALQREGGTVEKANDPLTRLVYLQSTERGIAGGGEWPVDLGPELSRGFRALKIWMALKEHGIDAFARSIERNCRQAKHLAAVVLRTPGAELLNDASLNIVCFRFHPTGWDEAALDGLN